MALCQSSRRFSLSDFSQPDAGGEGTERRATGRDQSPSLGRWVLQEPAGYVDGADLYQFVGSDPTAAVDPSGLKPPGPRHAPKQPDKKRPPVHYLPRFPDSEANTDFDKRCKRDIGTEDGGKKGTYEVQKEVLDGLSDKANPKLKDIDKYTGFLTTPLFKDPPIFGSGYGWVDAGYEATATGELVYDMANSNDGFYTIDMQLSSITITGGGMSTMRPFPKDAPPRFIRIEVIPKFQPPFLTAFCDTVTHHQIYILHHPPKGQKAADLVQRQRITVSGHLFIDLDKPHFYEIHPTDRPIDIGPPPPKQ